MANTLNLPIDVPAEGDFGGAFGAARLGLIAAEGADPIAVCRPPEIRHTVEPYAAAIQSYAAAHRRYRVQGQGHYLPN